MVQVGDKVVVQGIMPPAEIESIEYDSTTNRTVIKLDWGSRGKSTIYAHDENKLWYKYTGTN